MVASSEISSYTDLAGLSRLRARAADNDPAAIREAAHQFEALFLQFMLKSMRDASAVMAEDRDRSYEQMFDQQIALELADRESLGLGDLLMRQIGAAKPRTESAAAQPDAAQAVGAVAPSTLAPRSTLAETGAAQPIAATDEAAANRGAAERAAAYYTGHAMRSAERAPRRHDFQPNGPSAFVREIWPHARRVAEALGIDVRGIVAQAALETGWGQKLIRDEHGVSGNNLFGIKADERWTGERIAVQTVEYEAFEFVPRLAEFRAYPTLAEGFRAFAEYLSNNPRYETAVADGSNPEGYATALQSAGYATDPDYAAKIAEILRGPLFNEVWAEVVDTGGADGSL